MGRGKRYGAGALVTAVMVSLPLGVAAADTTTTIGTFDELVGSSTDYSTTMRLDATGFPEAAVTSTSRSGQVGPQSGASTWFPAASPPGQVFGSSRDLPYLNLRPRADSATSPSTTTYRFERPTPQGWGFVLGDVDADQVRVSAVTADGTAATVDELGFEGTFNLCATSPRPSGCSTTQPKDKPTWLPASTTLRGNAAAEDTYGASGWFRPTTALRSLTFTFTRRAGFPVFQTWFGVVRRDVTGTVTGAGTCAAAGRTLQLLDRQGTVVATTETDGAGAYAFDAVAASDGWTARLVVPDDCIATTGARRSVDTSDADASADFGLREIVPAAISGRVVTTDDEPVAGATVRITGDGGTRETVTDADGRYLFDENQPDEYTITVVPPAGFTVESSPPPVEVPEGDETPRTADDAVLAPIERGSLSVSVVDEGGDPVEGVDVRVTGPGTDVTITTDADGSATLGDLDAGTYVVSVGDTEVSVVVPEGGAAEPVTITLASGATPSPTPTAPTPTVPDPSSPSPSDSAPADGLLPDTGGSSRWLPIGAVVVLLAGGGLVLVARRRR